MVNNANKRNYQKRAEKAKQVTCGPEQEVTNTSGITHVPSADDALRLRSHCDAPGTSALDSELKYPEPTNLEPSATEAKSIYYAAKTEPASLETRQTKRAVQDTSTGLARKRARIRNPSAHLQNLSAPIRQAESDIGIAKLPGELKVKIFEHVGCSGLTCGFSDRIASWS